MPIVYSMLLTHYLNKDYESFMYVIREFYGLVVMCSERQQDIIFRMRDRAAKALEA